MLGGTVVVTKFQCYLYNQRLIYPLLWIRQDGSCLNDKNKIIYIRCYISANSDSGIK